MPPQRPDELDVRIVELWRSGVRSARDVGLQIGLAPMHVGRRIARMIRSRTWPLDLPLNAHRGARRMPVGFVALPRPAVRPEPTRRADVAPLNFRIAGDLHTRLRTYCRETGATVSETVAQALEAFLRTKQSH